MLQIRPVVLQRIERADQQTSWKTIERKSGGKNSCRCRCVSDESVQHVRRWGGDQLIIATAMVPRVRGTPPVRWYV